MCYVLFYYNILFYVTISHQKPFYFLGKGVDLAGRVGGEKPEGGEGGKSVIKIYM